jgi:polysaccharide biosynthesis protein PslG
LLAGRVLAILCVLVGIAWLAAMAHVDAAFAKKKARAASVSSSQLRGVQLTPNFAFMVGPYGQSDADDSHEIDATCGLGADLVRVGVSWPVLEQDGPGRINQDYVAKLDTLMTERNRCGIHVIMELAGIPGWDNGQHSPIVPPTDGGAAFRRVVAWVLNRWPSLDALEVSNEPNLSTFWAGTPADYAQLVNAAVAGKRDAGSGSQILAGALAGDGAAGYLQQLYASGMHGEDGVSIHPYSTTCAPLCQPFTNPVLRRSPFRSSIESTHRTMLQNNDPARLWLTEFGFSTCPSVPVCLGDGQQAAWDAQSVRIASCYPYIAGFTVFNLRDLRVPASWDSTAWDFHFGLMGSDFTPKPAYGAVQTTFAQLDRMANGAQRARASSARHRKRMPKLVTSTASSRMCTRLLGNGRARK